MMIQTYTQSLRQSFLCFFLFLNLFAAFSQKGFSFHAGAGVNTTFCPTLRSDDIRGISKGVLSITGNANVKLRFSRHFSMILQYAAIKSHINVRMKDIEVYYFDRYAQIRQFIGYMNFSDDLYLNWHQVGLNFNYEIPFQKNTLVVGLGINQAFYNSYKNSIARHYETLPHNSAISDMETRQTSNLDGQNVKSASLSLTYERFIYSNRLGLFGRIEYYYNFYPYSADYKYSDMGLGGGYRYYDRRGASSDFSYYSFSFQTLNFTIGAFYKINFKSNEKTSTH